MMKRNLVMKGKNRCVIWMDRKREKKRDEGEMKRWMGKEKMMRWYNK